MDPQNTNSGGTAGQNQPTQNSAPNLTTPDTSTVMGVLAYLGPLVIVSFITSKDNPFVKFHIKQGLLLLVIEAAGWVLRMSVGPMLWNIWWLFSLLNLVTLILSIVGIINVLQKKQEGLPVIGGYASFFKF